MKIKTGFVSNSSSTSYCIWGMNIEWKQIKEELQKKLLVGDEDEPEGFVPEEWAYILKDMFPPIDSFYGECDWEEGNDFGIEFYRIKDGETGRQFKDKVEDLVRQILRDDVNVEAGVIDVCYRDG